MRDTDLFLFGTDDKYVPHLAVAITSLAHHGVPGERDAQVRVLHSGLSEDNLVRLRRLGEAIGLPVEPVAVDFKAAGFPVTDWISPAAYLRLTLAVAAADFSRAVYLDCDLIVTGSLRELFERPMHNPIGAVRDFPNPVLGDGPALPGFEQLGRHAGEEYFNSGVMLVDVPRWIDETLADRVCRFLADHGEHTRFWDQCALNAVLEGGWDRLPQTYNSPALSTFMPSLSDQYRFEHLLPLEDALRAERESRVLHFSGPFKPWQPHYPDSSARRRYKVEVARLNEVENR